METESEVEERREGTGIWKNQYLENQFLEDIVGNWENEKMDGDSEKLGAKREA